MAGELPSAFSYLKNISGCLMHTDRNVDYPGIMRPRDLYPLTDEIWAENETRPLFQDPSKYDIFNKYRLLVAHQRYGDLTAVMTLVDNYDEASTYPTDRQFKFFTTTIFWPNAANAYLRLAISEKDLEKKIERPSTYKPGIKVIMSSLIGMEGVNTLDTVYSIRKAGKVSAAFGTGFIPFAASENERIVHPLSGDSTTIPYDAKGFITASHLHMSNSGPVDKQKPKRRSIITCEKSDRHNAWDDVYERIEFLSETRFAPGFAGAWHFDGAEFREDPYGEYIVSLTDTWLTVVRPGFTTVLPSTSRTMPLLPLEPDDTPQDFYPKYWKFFETEVLPHLDLTPTSAYLRGFSQ